MKNLKTAMLLPTANKIITNKNAKQAYFNLIFLPIVNMSISQKLGPKLGQNETK